MPRRLGQHFLADRSFRKRIADALRLQSDHLVIEIGAGRGALTELLAERAGLVAAVELDPPLAACLRQKFAGEPRVRVIEADILELDLNRVVAESGYARVKAAGNLPYYITSPILMRLFQFADRLEEIAVMVQLEVAERLAARPGSRDYGLLTAITQYYARPEMLFRIPPGAFQPPPKVDSALVRMVVGPRGAKLGIGDPERFFGFLRACFRQKRKTLLNNLKADYGAEQASSALTALGLKLSARAEELTLDQFADLWKLLERKNRTQMNADER